MAILPSSMLVQLSDIHFSGDKLLKLKNILPAKGLQQVLHHIENTIPGFKIFILTGDLVATPEPVLYQDLAAIFTALPYPVVAIPGNHDSLNMMEKYFFGQNITSKFFLSVENWLAIFLNSTHKGKVEHAGRIIQSDLDLLENTLAQHPNQNALIFLHHPPISFGAAWFRTILLENSEEFNAVLERFEQVKAILFGHAHTEYRLLRKKKLYLACPSTWAQIDHSEDNKVKFASTPPAYNSYQLCPDGSLSFMTHYCWK
jgi:Icc protein